MHSGVYGRFGAYGVDPYGVLYGALPYPEATLHGALVPTEWYGYDVNGNVVAFVLPPNVPWSLERPAPSQAYEVPGWGPTQFFSVPPPGPVDYFDVGLKIGNITKFAGHLASDIGKTAVSAANDVKSAIKDAGKVSSDLSQMKMGKVASDATDLVRNLANVSIDSTGVINKVIASVPATVLGRLGVKVQDPTQIANDLLKAVESGDMKHVREVLVQQARMASEMVAYVPGIGTAAAEALSIAASVIDGDKPLGVALHLMMTLPPFAYLPPPVPEVLGDIIDALVEITEGKSAKDAVSDVVIYEVRQKVLSNLPPMPDKLKTLVGQFFDSAVQLVFHRKPIANVAEDLARKAIAQAMPAATSAIAAPLASLASKLTPDMQEELKEIGKSIPIDVSAKLDAMKDKLSPAQKASLSAEFDALKAKATAAIAPMSDVMKHHDQLENFVRNAQTTYASAAAKRAVAKNIPPLNAAALQAVYQGGLTSNDYKDVLDRQRTLILYNRQDQSTKLKDRALELSIGDPKMQHLAMLGIGTFIHSMTSADVAHATSLAADIQNALTQKKIQPALIATYTDLLKQLTDKIHSFTTTKSYVSVPPREPDPYMTQPLSFWVARYTGR